MNQPITITHYINPSRSRNGIIIKEHNNMILVRSQLGDHWLDKPDDKGMIYLGSKPAILINYA